MQDAPTPAHAYRARTSERGQPMAPASEPISPDAFGPVPHTTLRWLGMAGFLVNARGTTLMIDPVLGGFDMPVLIDFPLAASGVPSLDAVLLTHSDNDHFSRQTCRDLAPVIGAFHATNYVASLLPDEGIDTGHGHDIGAEFEVGKVQVLVTPADHAWQNAYPQPGQRVFADDDACGFWLRTPDGTIWAPGDSRLIPGHHLRMPAPDVMLFDFSDSEWHFGLAGAIEMANAYPEAALLLHHWGCVDSPEFSPFNGDPAALYERVTNPERIHVLSPGEPFVLAAR